MESTYDKLCKSLEIQSPSLLPLIAHRVVVKSAYILILFYRNIIKNKVRRESTDLL